MWTDIFSALSAAIAFCSAVGAVFAARRAYRVSVSLRGRLRSCESQLELTGRSLEESRELLTELANKIKMTKLRNVVRHGSNASEAPDPFKEPEAWRKYANVELLKGRIPKSQ